MNVNQVNLIGRLTDNPRYNESAGVVNIPLAVNTFIPRRDGDTIKETLFIDCEAWGNLAKFLSKRVQKGNEIYVSGRLKRDVYEKDGAKRYAFRVRIQEVDFRSRDASTEANNANGEVPVVSSDVDAAVPTDDVIGRLFD
jgi:single-strand DNA-binding protein